MTSLVTSPRLWLPVLILLAAVLGAAGLLSSDDDAPPAAEPVAAPLVEVARVTRQAVRLDVLSHGEVSARTSSELVAEVSGRVERVAPEFVAGAFVEPGTPLLWLDTVQLEAALARAEASLAQARAALAVEQREAEIAREEWDDLGGGGEPHALLLREPQLAERRALEASASSDVASARRDLERAVVRAPYAARVVERVIDPGAWVAPGTRLGRVDAVDVAEVRLPIRDEQLAYLALPLARDAAPREPVPVTLSADLAGRRWSWDGVITRTEGRLDASSRMLHLVAQVRDPYASVAGSPRPPLLTGLFVEARVRGRELPDVLVVPRTALRTDGSLWVVDADDRLRRRVPDVLRAERERVLLSDGVEVGERVLVSILEGGLEGQLVRVTEAAERAP